MQIFDFMLARFLIWHMDYFVDAVRQFLVFVRPFVFELRNHTGGQKDRRTGNTYNTAIRTVLPQW